MGITEIADLLGVSTPRAHQLTKSKGFPKRANTNDLARGDLWRESAVRTWAKKVGRLS